MNFAENTVRYAQISAALSRSRFRSRFRLGLKDRQYICDRGWETMRRHAAELVAERLAPAFIPNDGKQTPMRGHPVFIAQHATACCCRGCGRYFPPGMNRPSVITCPARGGCAAF